MRIISGYLGGRQFDAPKGQRTHPMSDRVRGGLFNALGDVTGLTVLDAFAGSGALSLEAVSRGSGNVLAIDIDKRAREAMVKNIKTLEVTDKVKVVKANASSWSDNNQDKQFDLLIAAPPYDDLQLSLVNKLVRHAKTNGLFVLDWPGKLVSPELNGLKQIKQLTYGDAQLVFYRWIS